ncbi:heterokaryon incompatibility protein-domain-containing protein [Triangularia verruculosa]|uniref:Heterokaryon incompatibility protein-domain-containing protein n=1 Tax=Triangularia verruculosa TaxID=2587418 RepID=A0AAN6XF79_9PEZI|nr:heterokaryon incompatibility protein-domain-containing protein [Triangularia verruculosa]
MGLAVSAESSETAEAAIAREFAHLNHLRSLRRTNDILLPVDSKDQPQPPPHFVPRGFNEPYVFEPLPRLSDSFTIRLIRLLPGTWDSPVELELINTPMEPGKIPYYEAVSYSWGNRDPEFAISISCGGAFMRIGRSAAMLLRRFRYTDHTRLLWVDAICINQSDPTEKNEQVMKMDTIYQTASQVLVYLGEPDDTSDFAMDCISQRRVTQKDEPFQYAVLQLFSQREWFSRVWVLQEVALAEIALVICGAKIVPWACFPDWWTRNAPFLAGKAEPPPVLSYGPSVMKKLTLLQQLHETRHSKSTLPHDKIYALVGLLQAEDRIGVLVDYTQSTESLYVSVAKSIIERGGSLAILSGKVQDPSSNREELPSWVPDWSLAPSAVSLGLANKHLEPFDAGGKPACGVVIHTWPHKPATLECLGITFDTVKKTAVHALQPAAGSESASRYYMDLVTDWVNLVGTSSSTVTELATYLILRFNQQSKTQHPTRFSQPPKGAESLWTTLQALSTPTLELNPQELEARSDRDANIENLKFCIGRKLFITDNGALGLGPADIREDDTVAVLLGAPVPHILRKKPPSGHDMSAANHLYTLVGECFVEGIMAGEALNHLQDQLKGMGHRCRTFSKSCSSSALETFFLQ